MIYQFLGTESVTNGTTLKTLGQRIELDEQAAKDAITGGCALLPEDDFAALGFSDAEVKRYAGPFTRERAPEEFWAKMRAGWLQVAQLREQMEQEG